MNNTARDSFGKVSTLYDNERRGYHPAVFSDIITLTKLSAGAHILEIGIGTGKGTRPFAEHGCNITAIEISEEMLNLAKKNLSEFSGIEYILANFDTHDFKDKKFDLVYAAQSIHYADPNTVSANVHKVLNDNGHLAIFATYLSFENSFGAQLKELFLKHCPLYPPTYGSLQGVMRRTRASKLFSISAYESYNRSPEYTKEKYNAFLNTFSWISTLSDDQRATFFSALDKLYQDMPEPLIVQERTELAIFAKV